MWVQLGQQCGSGGFRNNSRLYRLWHWGWVWGVCVFKLGVGGMGGWEVSSLLEAAASTVASLAILASRQSSALKTGAQVSLIQWVVESQCHISGVCFSRPGRGYAVSWEAVGLA